MKNAVFICLFMLSCLSLSACSNTLNGAGQDMEKAGRSIQETF